MATRLCKHTYTPLPPPHFHRVAGLRRPRILLVCFLFATAVFPACTWHPPRRTISLQTLITAPTLERLPTRQYIAADPAALRPLSQSLGGRITLIQVCNRHDWELLGQAVGHIGPCPDFQRGIVVGLVCQAGTPLDGRWPFGWEAVRVHEGAGLLEASFAGGSYLADGTTYVETAYVEGLSAVLVVAIDGNRFYPG